MAFTAKIASAICSGVISRFILCDISMWLVIQPL